MKKRLFVISSFALIVLLFTFCNRNKSTNINALETSNSLGLSAADTIEVIDKSNNFMNLLYQDNVDSALSMLYNVTEDDKVLELNDEEKNELTERFKTFPVLSYKLENFSFGENNNNTIKYSTEFFEKKDSDKVPNTIVLVLNPVKIGNVWYLTLKNLH